MDRYISVNNLKKELSEDDIQFLKLVISNRKMQTVEELIDEMPSADVRENIHGEWLDSSNGWTCSICYRDNTYDTKFCPNCGADMRGETE